MAGGQALTIRPRGQRIGSTDEGGGMAKVINCDCGYTVRGESDEELLAQAHKHIDEAHPDMKDKVTDDQLLAQAQDA
jgi:predicted small metal-binding protein